MRRFNLNFCLIATAIVIWPVMAADQTKLGEGNSLAVATATGSPLVQSSRSFLIKQVNRIEDANLRIQLQGLLRINDFCYDTRSGLDDAAKAKILQKLQDEGLIDPAEASKVQGGLIAGVFPPVRDDGNCAHSPQPFFSAPGGAYHGHHSYPGGLMPHVAFNTLSATNLANGYRRTVGGSREEDGLPVMLVSEEDSADIEASDVFLSNDLVVGAPLWHDMAKPLVFQWNADGSEFTELSFGGNGKTDAWGAAGDSKTGAHHIIGGAEAMKRGLSSEFVIAVLSAHSNPTSGNEYKLVNWIRTAAILAQVDPVKAGYLFKDTKDRLRLAPVRRLWSIDLVGGDTGHVNFLTEYLIDNLSDADSSLTGPAVTEVESMLANLAPRFGYSVSDTTNYQTKFRNPVLAYFTAERLLMIYAANGLNAVSDEISKVQTRLTK